MRRVCVVITARPSYSRIKSALRAISDHRDLELQLVVTGSALLDRYGSAVDVMRADGFTPDAQAFVVLEGENLTSMAKTTGLGILELSTIFDNLRPDAVLTVADRFETMATAVAASYMNIPLIHVQGGEVSGSIDEKVRHAVTKLSDLHLVATELAAERVIRMGEEEGRVHVTGCPSIDLAANILDDPQLAFDPFDRYGGVGERLDLTSGYVVVLQHPVTTEYQQAREHAHATLEAVESFGAPALWFWPNVDAGADGTSNAIRAFRELRHRTSMHFFKNMTPEDFLRLVYSARVLVGNSSVGIRECSYLGVPVVNIGTRQGGRERGMNVVDCSHDLDSISEAIDAQWRASRYESDPLYGDGKAGQRISDVVANAPLTIDKRLAY